MSEKRLLGDQPAAYEAIRLFFQLSGGGMYLLQGYAGTGKTYMTREVSELVPPKSGRIIVTAPTHKAVMVLRKGTWYRNVEFMTTYAALGLRQVINSDGTVSFKPDHSMGFPADDYTHIIVDEASMTNDEIFDILVPLALEQGKKILFVGDSMQIPPVGQKFAMPFDKEVRKRYGIEVSTLNTIIRQEEGSPVIDNATLIRSRIHAPTQILNSQAVENHLGGVYPISREKEQPFFQSDILPMYKSPMYERSIDYVKVIGWRNITVDSYNKQIREFIFGMNLPKIIKGDKLIADAPIVEAGRTLLNTNEEMEVVDVWINNEDMGEGAIIKYYYCQVRSYSMDKYNEFMIRIIHEDSEEFYKKILSLQAKLANSYPKGSFQARSAWIDYYKFIEHWHQVKYSYAITAHKSQGSTYENAYVLKWDIEMNRDVFERNRILYTACTRPSKNLFIVV